MLLTVIWWPFYKIFFYCFCHNWDQIKYQKKFCVLFENDALYIRKKKILSKKKKKKKIVVFQQTNTRCNMAFFSKDKILSVVFFPQPIRASVGFVLLPSCPDV